MHKRGIYYCGRMLSAQYGKEFTSSHYENVKKVFSIWICVNPPTERKHTANRYVLKEEQMLGDVSEDKESYDLIELVLLCLGDKKQDEEVEKMCNYSDFVEERGIVRE